MILVANRQWQSNVCTRKRSSTKWQQMHRIILWPGRELHCVLPQSLPALVHSSPAQQWLLHRRQNTERLCGAQRLGRDSIMCYLLPSPCDSMQSAARLARNRRYYWWTESYRHTGLLRRVGATLSTLYALLSPTLSTVYRLPPPPPPPPQLTRLARKPVPFFFMCLPECGVCKAVLGANSKHWFTTSFLQPLPYLVTPPFRDGTH